MSTTTTDTPVLEIDRVTLRHGDGDSTVVALDEVSLSVAPGELVAVVGPSGSGKSSLLAVAGALTAPESGTVRLEGVDLGAADERERARLRRERIGFVFQSGNLLPALTCVDQLRLALRIAGIAESDPRARDPRALLDSVSMTHRADRRPSELSGGERQRVGIARALVAGPALLLVDEPTAALDRARSHEVVELLAREVESYGAGAIMVTHDHDVLEHCHRVVEMVDGRLGVPAATA
ncbi:ATP-binding cassette domain-containing protein [Cellulosimicrobium sp. BIT-GX5]|uniref:ATP-binding cassette domain-containing protein n=1 Tax=Cellulosimicrobium composti TaxID=2672572 RepID=A0A6N7ZLM1_9MICO|nr:ABC transporter ATP-binding protein [Cellulosimicrobium composti]MTG90173.1 ATP-binding cassette domain-containing protein [Cellulosimicrobium composti]TWG75789.1 putative ABC transport system ATP-binding protein [Cellulosimicrobium cellulans J34]SMF30202.1 putative ABC transport system ATP-binding protein [Cellulosimicrobium cellulans J1]